MGRSIGAVTLGFLYAVAGIWLTQMILWFSIPEEPGAEDTEAVPELRLALTVFLTFASSFIAGFVTAHVARQVELVHGLALGALLVAVLGVTTMVVQTEPTPAWYQLALPAVALPGTLLGATLRARVPRPPPPAPPKPPG
ncbi:MAG TPA: TIGR04086 family membrane protein [Gemmataceae bacterium]|nr:TIGR04086 family membrane protein [Gemmataceae bacterium]